MTTVMKNTQHHFCRPVPHHVSDGAASSHPNGSFKLVSKSGAGFTLIEMLVVIAIIGILSAAVLVSLGPARNKAKDARVISGLEQARVLLETKYDVTLGTYSQITWTVGEFQTIAGDIKSNNGGYDPIEVLPAGGSNVAVSAQLNGTGHFYCVDTLGHSTETAGHPTAGDCDTAP